jgi:hypothetical protein
MLGGTKRNQAGKGESVKKQIARFWNTPHGMGYRAIWFAIKKLPPVSNLIGELDAAVEYHSHYSKAIDRALGQPRGEGDLLKNNLREILRIKKLAKLTCRDCGANGPLVNGLCAGCFDEEELKDPFPCTCSGGYDPECPSAHEFRVPHICGDPNSPCDNDCDNRGEPQFKCTVCGQIGSVGRCCGLETRKPMNFAAHLELQST